MGTAVASRSAAAAASAAGAPPCCRLGSQGPAASPVETATFPSRRKTAFIDGTSFHEERGIMTIAEFRATDRMAKLARDFIFIHDPIRK